MTSAETRGRTIVLVLIAFLVCPGPVCIVIQLIAAGRPLTPGVVIGTGIDMIVGWCLYRGYYWARVYVPASLLLVGAGGVLATFGAEGWDKVTMLTSAALHLSAAVVLWTSPTVAAYFEHHGASRTVVLDLNSHDGV